MSSVVTAAAAASAHGCDVSQLKQLSITQAGLRSANSIGLVAAAPSLQELNLSFNEIGNLNPLTCLNALTHLNVSHNRLTSLNPVSQLTALRVVRANNNNLVDLMPLSHCCEISELWVGSNSFASLAVLKPLAALTELKTLVFKPNQSAVPKSMRNAYPQAVASLLPKLLSCDAAQIGPDERKVAEKWLLSDEGKTMWRSMGLGIPKSSSASTGVPSRTKSRVAVKRAAPSTAKARVSKGGAGSATLGSVGQPTTTDANLQSAVNEDSTEVESVSVAASGAAEEADDGDDLLARAKALAAASAAIPSLQQNPVKDSEEKAVARPGPAVSSLPSGQKSMNSGPRSAQAPTRTQGAGAPFVIRYPLSASCGSRSAAVTVRADGSAVIKYPGGAMAVSVDKDGDGWRIYASYRRTSSIAVCFDSAGVGGVYDTEGRSITSEMATNSKGIRLDDSLGVQFGEPLRVFYKCDGVGHVLVQGANPRKTVWSDEGPMGLKPQVKNRRDQPVQSQDAAIAQMRAATESIVDFTALSKALSSGADEPKVTAATTRGRGRGRGGTRGRGGRGRGQSSSRLGMREPTKAPSVDAGYTLTSSGVDPVVDNADADMQHLADMRERMKAITDAMGAAQAAVASISLPSDFSRK